MKRILVSFTVVALLLLVVGPAFGGHRPEHKPPPGQGGGPGGGNQTPSCTDGKGGHNKPSQNKHCYPGNTSRPNSSGKNASFAGEVPEVSGLTVGMATVAAVGALGALLMVRRRWVFRTPRR
ncbi:MAG: hypothetical protein ACRDH9_03415 [Actinomycetota bacterium]